MPFEPPRSLLTPFPEPLPLYTPRQSAPNEWETASVRSDAPSYVSAAPSYHSSAPPHHLRACDLVPEPENSRPRGDISSEPSPSSPGPSHQIGLPSPQRYAPGFESRGGDLSHINIRSLYSIAEWVPVTGGLQARHYQNVAKRRVTDLTRSGLPALTLVPPEPTHVSRYENTSTPDGISRRFATPALGVGSSSTFGESHNLSSSSLINGPNPRPVSPPVAAGSSTSVDYHPGARSIENLPLSPLEDPDLVGEAAAARFRSQRIYRVLQQEENSLQENQPSGSNSRNQELRQAAHVYQYSSLITDAANPRVHQRPSTAPGLSTETTDADEPGPSYHVARTRQRSNTVDDYDEWLRAQESRTWDCMMEQMAEWEARQRSWKKFKDGVDKRLNSSLKKGMGWGTWSSSSGDGKRKLKKEFGSHPRMKKWKNKVGLAG
ncbi:hypothetical protein LOZ66_004855 [Ophidiomyces ophidiicola]|nr:hypothetical protein LOZ66_004855 [Ophidiomyces ophidiicola]